jgi:arylsulfatase A-like enzyme/tetratricopeptide (TPR) repeat protein
MSFAGAGRPDTVHTDVIKEGGSRGGEMSIRLPRDCVKGPTRVKGRLAERGVRRRIGLVRFRRTPIIVFAVVSVGLIVFAWTMFNRRAWQPGQGLRRAWAKKGVERPNVVLITLDTTRADHLGCYGDAEASTPVIDELAKGGVLFSQAASPAPLTQPSHCSIMTGFYPAYHGVRLNGVTALGQGQTTLAEVFSGQGYQTGAFIGAFVLDGRWGLNQGFLAYDDHFDMKKFKHLDLAGTQRPGNEVMDAALHWLDGHKDRPFFTWIHLYDPHTPYDPPEPFRSQFAGRGLAGLYDGEIAFADQQVGRVVSWLQAAGLEQHTIVVVVGDHGEGLGSHGEGNHGFFVYDYAVHVPFIIATPFEELRGVHVDTQVSLVDVFPTVLALAGIERKAGVQGRSLVPLMFRQGPPEEVDAYSECLTASLQYGWSPLRSLRSARYKFIQAPRPELYDLAADPGEATNVYDKHPAMAAAMNRELERLAEETGRNAPAPEAANLDRETMQRLAALGYVGTPGAASTPAGPTTALADPKDKLQVFSGVQRAGELMTEDDYVQAAQMLEAAVREEPDMPQALLMLGGCYTELGRRKEARAQFDLVLKKDPKSVQALIGMANVLMEDGLTEDVVTLCKRTLSIDERNTQAYALLGDVYIGQHQPSKALPYLEKAVEVQPKITQNRLNLAACLIEVKQLQRAQALLQEILSAYPRFPGAQFNLGVLYEELQRPEEARAAYLAEIANHPNGFKARFNLGKLLAAGGDWPGSIEQMRGVMRIAPKLAEGYLFLARALLQQSELLHQSAPLDQVQALADQGLSLARTPELKALGWFVMADVFNRRHQPDKVNIALRNARMQLSLQKGDSSSATPRD